MIENKIVEANMIEKKLCLVKYNLNTMKLTYEEVEDTEDINSLEVTYCKNSKIASTIVPVCNAYYVKMGKRLIIEEILKETCNDLQELQQALAITQANYNKLNIEYLKLIK